jgi:hypothetical protein
MAMADFNGDDDMRSGQIGDFDQTNGKAQGLEGDDSGDVSLGSNNADRSDDGILSGLNDPFAAITVDQRDGSGATDEDDDPAVTQYSEESDR